MVQSTVDTTPAATLVGVQYDIVVQYYRVIWTYILFYVPD